MAKGTRRKTTTRRTKKTGDGRTKTPKQAETYKHPEADSPMRPEVGTQPQFRKKKPPKTYRYDSSLSPELNWDGQNPARELGEWLLARIDEAAVLDPPHAFPEPQVFKAADGTVLTTVRDLRDAVEQLKRLGQRAAVDA